MVIMKFQIDYLAFIRFMREGNFKPCNKFMMSVVKLFFIFNQYNYERWLSVYIEDLLSLPITCPKLYQGFEGGNFVVQISGSQFHKSIMNNLTTKQLSISKGQSVSWIVQAMSYREGGDRRTQNCRILKASQEYSTHRYQPKWNSLSQA